MISILVTDKLGKDGLDILAKRRDVEYELQTGLSKDELIEIIPAFDALIIRSGTRVDVDVLSAGSRLKVVGRAGIGVDNIDVKAATENGILVMNSPRASAIATAEHTMALMLSISRQLPAAHVSLLDGDWRRSEFVGYQLYEKTLGIIGFGRIGRLVGNLALGFGLRVLVYDPYISDSSINDSAITRVELRELLSQSDIITLHATITPETEGIIDTKAIERMKNGVILVNTARGKLIDEAALARALGDGKVRAAAVDVYGQEPPIDNPLLGLPNVLHTPHLGASTIEAQRDVAVQIVEQVLDALDGNDFRNTLNVPFGAQNFIDQRPYLAMAEHLGLLQSALAAGPVQRVDLDIVGRQGYSLLEPAVAAFLKGLLEMASSDRVNYINAPSLAEQSGITVSQGAGTTPDQSSNMVSSTVYWDGNRSSILVGMEAGSTPQIFKVDEFELQALLEGILLFIEGSVTPDIIGQVESILETQGVLVTSHVLSADRQSGELLSVWSLETIPSTGILKEIEMLIGVINVWSVTLPLSAGSMF